MKLATTVCAVVVCVFWLPVHAQTRTDGAFAADCVNALAPKWSARLAAFDVYVWGRCYAMEQTLGIDK